MVELKEKTVEELRKMASRKKIEGRSKMNKAELVKALKKKTSTKKTVKRRRIRGGALTIEEINDLKTNPRNYFLKLDQHRTLPILRIREDGPYFMITRAGEGAFENVIVETRFYKSQLSILESTGAGAGGVRILYFNPDAPVVTNWNMNIDTPIILPIHEIDQILFGPPGKNVLTGEYIGEGNFKKVWKYKANPNYVVKINKKPTNTLYLRELEKDIQYSKLLTNSGFTPKFVREIKFEKVSYNYRSDYRPVTTNVNVGYVEEIVIGRTLTDEDTRDERILDQVQNIINRLRDEYNLLFDDHFQTNFMYGHTESDPVDKVYIVDVGMMIDLTSQSWIRNSKEYRKNFNARSRNNRGRGYFNYHAGNNND